MYVGPTVTSLYLWVGLIVMAEGVQVSSSEQLPQQPGRLAQPLQGFGQMLNPLTPGFLLWLGPLSFPLPPTRWAVSGAALSGSETTQLLYGLRQVTSLLWVSVSLFKAEI